MIFYEAGKTNTIFSFNAPCCDFSICAAYFGNFRRHRRGFSGIDVSVYQGDIDFEQVKNSGIEVVYIRAGYGFSVTDPKFEENYTNATKAGLKCGAYYFVTARNTEQAYLQATRFAELISGKTFAARPAMDFEEFGSLGKTA